MSTSTEAFKYKINLILHALKANRKMSAKKRRNNSRSPQNALKISAEETEIWPSPKLS